MKQIFQIIIFLLPFLVFGQQGEKINQPHTKVDSITIAVHTFTEKPDSIALEHYLIRQLTKISYNNIESYQQIIKKLEPILQSDSTLNEELYLQALRLVSLSHYKNKEYELAQKYFQNFFSEYKRNYNNDTSYIYEYSLYIFSYYFQDKGEFIYRSKEAISNILEKSRRNVEVCRIMTNLAYYYNRYRVLDSARYYIDKALTQYQKSGKTNYEILSDIYKIKGLVESYSENHELSKIYIEQAIEYLLLTEYTETELAYLYNKKGIAFLLTNQPKNAMKYFKLVLQIYKKEQPGSKSLGIIYYNLGMVYSELDDYKNALYYFNKSLEIEPDISNYFTHRFIANTYFELDSIDLAKKKYKEILDYLTKSENNDTYQIAFTKLSYGQLLLEKTNEKEEGEKILTECIDGFYKHFNGIDINLITPLNILGTYYVNNGQIDRGLDSLQKAISISAPTFEYNSFYENPDYKLLNNRDFSNNTLAWKAYGLYLRYLKTDSIKDLKASQETYNFYIHCAGENRKYFDNASSIVTSSQVHYVYNQAINVTYLLYLQTKNAKYLEEIFKFIEGKKSFTLFQSLKILEQKKLLNIPKEMIEKEDSLKYQLNLVSEKINAQENSNSFKNELKKLRKTELRINESLDSLQHIFKEEYSGFYELKYGFRELSIEEIKNRIPENTAFVNYSISDSLLHIITFTNDTVALISETIDSEFFKNINTMVRLLKDVDTDNSNQEFISFSQSSFGLYQKLIKPIELIIQNHQIIFIPDDELNYISFDALINKLPSVDRPDYRDLSYLIENYKSNVANSMQIYFNMKQRQRNPNNEVYAFAPLYPLHPDTTNLPDEYKDLRPLDYAIQEVKSIERSMNTISFLGQEATKDTFRKSAKNAGILHLAMHTIINDKKPLQSKFLFTPTKDESSSMLNTYELLTLNLNAELAVLSGCSTGDGKLMKGEGVMSLSSGFQYAGVPAIVMSLWEVNDRFGSLVIQKFYTNLANGVDKKQALYQAKRDVLRQGNALYAHPYYWAGLTLIGDESKIQFINRYHWDKIVIIFSPILFIIVVLLQSRKKWLHKKT